MVGCGLSAGPVPAVSPRARPTVTVEFPSARSLMPVVNAPALDVPRPNGRGGGDPTVSAGLSLAGSITYRIIITISLDPFHRGKPGGTALKFLKGNNAGSTYMGAGRLSSPLPDSSRQAPWPWWTSIGLACSVTVETLGLGECSYPPGTVAYVPERLDEPARITLAQHTVVLANIDRLKARLLASIGSVRRESGNDGGSIGRFTVLYYRTVEVASTVALVDIDRSRMLCHGGETLGLGGMQLPPGDGRLRS